eukprot:GGOE01008257.1.p1 GENE.GGOE01008257.1~~GGOE01008257.1.p1  ORF type:complete len:471 (-),score=64.70 GGOE01008257.1:507-1844(-)
MQKPVMDREGHNFEKEAIEAWLQRHEDCPMGREPLLADGLFPNRALREEIQEWLAKANAAGGSAPTYPIKEVTPATVAPTVVAPAAVTTSKVDPCRPWAQYGMSQDDYDHVLCQFVTFDVDGSGELDRVELQRLCRYLNYPSRDVDIDRMFAAVDAQQKGQLDLHSFMSYMQNKRPKPELMYGISKKQYEEFMMQFSSFDRDEDGMLDRGDLQQLCNAQGYPSSPDILDRLFSCMDGDQSQRIDAHEFLMFMRYNDPRKAPPRTVVPVRYSASPTAQWTAGPIVSDLGTTPLETVPKPPPAIPRPSWKMYAPQPDNQPYGNPAASNLQAPVDQSGCLMTPPPSHPHNAPPPFGAHTAPYNPAYQPAPSDNAPPINPYHVPPPFHAHSTPYQHQPTYQRPAGWPEAGYHPPNFPPNYPPNPPPNYPAPPSGGYTPPYPSPQPWSNP